jgi:hypothetical protein
MFTTPRHDPGVHALARQRAHHLRREAIDQAWAALARLLRRAISRAHTACHACDSAHAGRPATLGR